MAEEFVINLPLRVEDEKKMFALAVGDSVDVFVFDNN